MLDATHALGGRRVRFGLASLLTPAVLVRMALIAWLAAIILLPLGSLFVVVGEHGLKSFRILGEERLLKILLNTATYTILTTAIALVLGLPLAWTLSRGNDRLTAVAKTIIALGFVLPEFIYAIAYVFLLDPSTGFLTRLIHLVFPNVTPPLYGLAGMSLITGLFCVPQIVILVEPAFRNVSSDLEEAAEICGSSTFNTLVRVALPLVMPAVLTSALLTFLLAFASFGIPAALGIPAYFYVLSTEVYSVVLAYPPRFDVAAVLSLIFLAVSLAIAAGQVLATRVASRYRTIGGKGFRTRQHQTPVALRMLRVAYIWTMALFVSLLPLAIVLAASFAKQWWKIPGPATLDNYRFVLGKDPLLASIAWTTTSVSVLTVLGTLGVALALCVVGSTRREGIAWWTAYVLGYIALSVPPIAFTVGALLVYVAPPLAFYGTIWILVLTYWARFYPLAASPISDGLMQLDPALRESGLVAGAGLPRVFWKLQLPLIRPIVVAAGLVVFMFTVRELLSAVFLQSSQIKMAMVAIFNYWDEGNLERAAAMSSVIVLTCVAVFVIANQLQRGATWRH